MKNFTNNHKNLDERQSLYCVWIAASEQPNAPLISVWIDPAMRAFERELQKVNCEVPMAAGVGRPAVARSHALNEREFNVISSLHQRTPY
jgi:hypothetical protein